MKILFSVYKSGLGNNGGSQSIIRMALMLRKLGHECCIISHMKNVFTWFPVPDDLNVIVSTDPASWPKCDALIATACTTWEDVVKCPNADRKLYWIRGIEKWNHDELKLAKGYKSGLTLMVNSEWQKEYIKDLTEVDSHVIYSGIPFQEIIRACKAAKKVSYRKITIGGLYSGKKGKRWGLFETIMEDFGDKFAYLAFGTEDRSSIGNLSLYVKRPNMVDKMSFMKSCNIWFAPTELEGLHIPPIEASIAGAALLCNGGKEGGMTDYAIHGDTALCWRTYIEAKDFLNYLANDPILRRKLNRRMMTLLVEKIGSVADNAARMLEVIKS